MANRPRAAQSAHDKAVQRIAREHENDGWNVRADVQGYSTPGLIAGRRPDIIATKRGSRRIIEVETDEDDDHAQHRKFRRHAGQKTNTYFEVVVVDAAGRKGRLTTRGRVSPTSIQWRRTTPKFRKLKT